MEDTQAEINQLKQGMNVPSPDTRMQAMQAGREALPSGGLPSLPAPNIGSAAMASGGIVAFNGEQGSAVSSGQPDVTKMSNEELRLLAKSPDINTARSANREMLNRSGYEPSAFPSSEVISQRFREAISTDKPTRIRYDERPLPSHMYDESGVAKVRSNPETARFFGPQPSEGSAPGIAPAAAAAAPTADAAPVTATPNAWGLGGAGTRNRATFPDMLPEQAAPEDPNADIYKEIDKLLGSGRAQGISAPRLNASSLFPDTRVSQSEQDKIRGDLRAEGEASGLPGLLRRGAERTGKDIEDIKKNKRSDTWLLLAQAGFGIAGSADPFGVAVGKAGQQFAGQYATLNKDLKKEIRELNKDQESYQKSMAEFELNQNSESRRRVDEAQRRIDSRQDKVAEMAMKQADLDFRAGIANQSEATQRRGMQLQALLAKIKNPEKVTLQSEFVNAARRGETAKMDALIVAAQRWAEASPQVIAARINNQNNPETVVGTNLNPNALAGFTYEGTE
jgi:hypothetical protein